MPVDDHFSFRILQSMMMMMMIMVVTMVIVIVATRPHRSILCRRSSWNYKGVHPCFVVWKCSSVMVVVVESWLKQILSVQESRSLKG